MEHAKEIQVAANDLIQCQFCSWRTAERFECTYEERRVIKLNELPAPSWCPLHAKNNLKSH
jgi:hypothetical protein